MYQSYINDPNSDGQRASVLASLRGLLPDRPITLDEARTIIERQAERLLDLQQVRSAPVPTAFVASLPRVAIMSDHRLQDHSASGSSDWDDVRHTWIISINPAEPSTRQRFTIMHEYWHIVMHFHPGLGGRLPRRIFGLPPIEYLADYFAGCVLVPKDLLKRAWFQGVQRPTDLGELFQVSAKAITVRLSQVGLSEPAYRCMPTTTVDRPARYYRSTNASHCIPDLVLEATHEPSR